jgi:hypothetical protein
MPGIKLIYSPPVLKIYDLNTVIVKKKPGANPLRIGRPSHRFPNAPGAIVYESGRGKNAHPDAC